MWDKLERKFSGRGFEEVLALLNQRLDRESWISFEELGVDDEEDHKYSLMEDAYYYLKEVDRDKLVEIVLGDEPFEDFLAGIAARKDETAADRRRFDRACDGPDPDPWGEHGPDDPYFVFFCEALGGEVPARFNAGPETFPKSLDEVNDPVLADLLRDKAGFYIAALGSESFLIDPDRFFAVD